jgi:WhiB family transcriptional regulator, redox-sensing transcriptional regulator
VATAVTDLPQPALSLLLELRRPAWQARAACRGLGTEDWFPTQGVSGEMLDRARSVCATCPVAEPCADAGDRESTGIWGGMTVQQRQRRRRARRAASVADPVAAPVAAVAAPVADRVPAPVAAPRRRPRGSGAQREVPMPSVWQPDAVTLGQWRSSPAGERRADRRSDLDDVLAVLERAFGRSRTAES